MASPDVFLSSPARTRRISYQDLSSSPGLPSVYMLSQKVKKPAIRSGSRAVAVPDDAITGFANAGQLWREEVAKEAQTAPNHQHGVEEIIDKTETPISVEVNPKKPSKPRKPRKPRPRKGEDQKTEAIRNPPNDDDATPKEKPWKKYKSKAKKDDEGANSTELPVTPQKGASAPVTETGKETGAVSLTDVEKELVQPSKAKKPNFLEPLQLEQAIARRTDWTPPQHKAPVIPDSDDSGVDEVDITAEDEPGKSFQSMLGSYKCAPEAQKEVIAISDEEGSFLKKRKLVELLVTNEGSMAAPPIPEKPPAKRKAPKKKPRTITEVATRDYRPATQPEPTPTIPTEEPEQVNRGKQRKRAARPSKRKPPRPKPVLLSPGAALKHVANQDFLFGTSSQLATEQSPTFLRDLHMAMRSSNQMEYIDFVTPINSDAIEPPEQRPKLWDAAARDEDGDLLDLEVIDITDKSPDLPAQPPDMNPFGYGGNETGCNSELPELSPEKSCGEGSLLNLSDVLPPPGCNHGLNDGSSGKSRGDDTFMNLSDILPSPAKKLGPKDCHLSERRVDDSFMNLSDIVPPPEAKSGRNDSSPDKNGVDDSFMNLSDILPSPAKQPMEILDSDSSLPGTQVSVCSVIQEIRTSSNETREMEHTDERTSASKTTEVVLASPDEKDVPSRPSYEVFTDAQLSKEITSYGFKPVKKRATMIALLDQCWKSKARIGPSSTRSFSALPGGSSKSSSTSAPKTTAKKTAKTTKTTKTTKATKTTQSTKTLKTLKKATKSVRPPSQSRTREDSVSEVEIQEPPPSAQPPSSPKKARGRPKKGTTSPSKQPKAAAKVKEASAAKVSAARGPATPKRKGKPKMIIEIADSASDAGSDTSMSMSPTPEPTFSPTAVDLSLTTEEDTELLLNVSPTDQQSELFEHITRAITTAPRTTDPDNPSWHEKILLYDPIVLEDLAAWLNSGQLTRIGYDGEVSSGAVKEWCESKSVCCLWKVNLRGQERKRY